MIIPPYLKPDDKIQIVSPAGKVDEKYIHQTAEWLTEQGYRAELGKHVFSNHFRFAGADSQRLEDLQAAFDDPDVSAIICSRGGYGTARIIDKLKSDGFFRHPKWVVGFSDITILHLSLNNNRVASIHGAMPRFFFNENGQPAENLKSLMQLLTGEDLLYNVAPVKENRQGTATGELIGGNLSVISAMQGTPWELESNGKILFLEETDEYLYHIDRMILQLKLSGKFEKLAGLVVGDFTDIKDNEQPFGLTVNEIIAQAVEEYDFPVCFGFPAGHGEKNLALTFGKIWELDVSENSSRLKQLPLPLPVS